MPVHPLSAVCGTGGAPRMGRSCLTPRDRTCWEGTRRRASGLIALSRPGHQLSTFILHGRPSPRAVCTSRPPSARGCLPGNVSSWSSPPGLPPPAPNRCGVTQHRQLLGMAWRPLSSLPRLRVGPQSSGGVWREGVGVAQPRALGAPSLPPLLPEQVLQHLLLLFGWRRGKGVSREGPGLLFCSCWPGTGGADGASAM